MAAFLFVQTAFNYHDVALIVDGEMQKHWHIDEPRQTLKFLSGILPELHDLTFDHIVFVQGPGSFTALRVGATWVNTLAYTRKVLIKNISTLAYICVVLTRSEKELAITFDDKRYFFFTEGTIVASDTQNNLSVYNPEIQVINVTESVANKLTKYSYPEPVISTDVSYVIPPKITLPKS